MKSVIFELHGINGALIDAIEYFLYINKVGGNVNLILVLGYNAIPIQEIFDLIEDRYAVDFEYKDKILIIKNKNDILKYDMDVCLIVDYGTTPISSIVRSKKIILLYDHHIDKLPMYEMLNKYDRFTVYNEMPFGIGEQYQMKFCFDLYKDIKTCLPYAYMNCNGKSVKELEKVKDHTKKPLIVTGKVEIPVGIGAIHYKKHPKNFMSLFDTYVYIHDGVYFEPRCRLLVECCYYNKDIIYINDYDIKDGGWYRHKEILSCGIHNRNMTIDDEVVREFLWEK